MTRASEIEAQAAEWLVRRDSGDGLEGDQFAAWLASDPRHRAAYLRLMAAWNRSARLKLLRPEGTSIDADLLLPGRKTGPRARWRGPLALAAGVVILAFAGLWITYAHGAQTYRTDIGGLSRVVLADGSTVTLNTDTEVQVRLGRDRREILLIRGEAQFAVAHDSSRPFDVTAGPRVIRAVGTAFDVRLDQDNAVSVIVTEGRVALLEADREPSRKNYLQPAATISAGESGTAGRGEVTIRPVGAAEALRHTAWQTGELSFQGETLAQAVAEFNRYNRRKLEVEDTKIATLRIGGNFQALDVDSFVAALGRSFGIVAKTAPDGTILLAYRASPAAGN